MRRFLALYRCISMEASGGCHGESLECGTRTRLLAPWRYDTYDRAHLLTLMLCFGQDMLYGRKQMESSGSSSEVLLYPRRLYGGMRGSGTVEAARSLAKEMVR